MARASKRLATLLQAISSTQPTAPIRSSSAGFTSPTMSSCVERTVALQSVLVSGYLSLSRPAIVAIAVCALISGLSLNGLTAWVAMGRAERMAPRLFAEYRTWLVLAAVLVVAAFSALGCYGTYVSMQDPRRLPNVYAVLTALWLLFLPVLMTFIGRRLKRPGWRPMLGGRMALVP